MQQATSIEADSREATRAILASGLMLGVGVMAALDTVLFHMILQWHNFYVHTDEYWRTVSDGLLHFVTTSLLFLGALRLWDDRHVLSAAGRGQLFAATLLIGAGGFQLFDGIVDHLILGLHPVREGVETTLPYDVAWNGAALLLLVIGVALWRRGQAEAARVSGSESGRARDHRVGA